MRREACGASALAIFALAAHGEPAPAVAPAGPEAASVAAGAEVEGKQHWWSFDTPEFLSGLGVNPDSGLFGLGNWRAFLDLRAIGNAQDTRAPDYPDQKFYSYLTEQGITVRNDGWYLFDPRLLTGSASVRFGLQQARQDAGDQGVATGGDVTDYYVSMTLLPEKAYTGLLQASRSEFVTSHPGGGTTSSTHESRGATLSWRESSILRDKEIAPYFSATLFGGQEDLQETTTNAGQQFRRDEHRDRVQFDAHNGFETADLTVSLAQVDLDNRIFPAGNYRSRSANMDYSLDFGKNLTMHSDTHVNYNDRTGEFGSTMLDLGQHLFFDHTAYLSSSVYYQLQDVDSESGSSTSNRVDAIANYLPFLNVSTSVGAFGSRVDFDTGTVDSEGGSLGATYNHWLPAGGVLSASANGSLQYTDSQLTSSTLPVVDSPYQAPPELGAGAGFLLNESNVVTTTIVVVNVRGGARLPTSLGVDYEVETEGNRTRIVPLATSLVIQGGDPLEISYSYLVDPSLRSRIRNQSYFLSADWDWIAVSLTHDVSRQEPLSGQQETLLSDQDRTTLRVDVRHDWGNWRAIANARAARYRDERLKYDDIRLNENLTWRPSYDWQLNLDASQTQSTFVDSGRISRYYDARLGGTYHSLEGWWTDGYLTWRAQRDTEVVNETITEAFLRVRRDWLQLHLSCSISLGQRERGSVQTTYENLQINITRTFW